MKNRLITIAILALLSSKAFAHFPTLNCTKPDAKNLSCVAGYSDGSLTGKVELKVYDYDDNLIKSLKTATDGSVTFVMPKSEFYIVFNPGHEDPAEFDYAELD